MPNNCLKSSHSCLTPKRGLEVDTNDIIFQRQEINELLKNLRQKPSSKLLEVNNLVKFNLKILSLFPDAFLIPLLEYQGANILFGDPDSRGGKRSKLSKQQQKGRQQTQLLLTFDQTKLPSKNTSFQELVDSYGEDHFYPDIFNDTFGTLSHNHTPESHIEYNHDTITNSITNSTNQLQNNYSTTNNSNKQLIQNINTATSDLNSDEVNHNNLFEDDKPELESYSIKSIASINLVKNVQAI
jgi:hypothetical protein